MKLEEDVNSMECKSSLIDSRLLSFLLLFIEEIEEIEENEPSDFKAEGGTIGVDERTGIIASRLEMGVEIAIGVDVYTGEVDAETIGEVIASEFVSILIDLCAGIKGSFESIS
jgi:hypothetical protein